MAGVALREILARFGIEVDSTQLAKGNRKVDDFAKRLENLGRVVAGAFVLTGVHRFVKSIFDEGRALYLASRRAGIAVEEYQGLEHATDLLNVSTQNLGVGIKYLHRNLALAANGNKQLGQTFEALGVSIQEGVPNDAQEAFLQIADAIKNIDDENIQTAMSMKVFGRSGALLLPVMKAGSATLKQYAGEVKGLGGGFTDTMAVMIDTLNVQIARQKMALRSVRAAILDTIIPALVVMTDALTATAKAFVFLNQHGESARVVVVSTLLAITAVCWPLVAALAALALPIIKIALLASAIEDLYVLFRGGDSLVGLLGDKINSSFTSTAAIFGNAVSVMGLSWQNFTQGLLAMFMFAAHSVKMLWVDTLSAFQVVCAKLEDSWNGFVSKFTKDLGLPPWLQKMLSIGDIDADAKAGKSREQQAKEESGKRKGDAMRAMAEDPAIANFKTILDIAKQSKDIAAQNEKQIALQKQFGGKMTDYGPNAGNRNTAGQRKMFATEERRTQVEALAGKFGGDPAMYWKNTNKASEGMIEELRRIAGGKDNKAKQATTLLASGKAITNRDAYKLIAPELLPRAERPKGFVETPGLYDKPAAGPIAAVAAPAQAERQTVSENITSTKTFTDNSSKVINVKVGADQKAQMAKLVKDMANTSLRSDMDREFGDPNFETED